MNKLFLNKLFIIILFLFSLTACTSLTAPVPAERPAQHWVLHGKIGIQTPDKTESAFVYWQQQGDIYHIRLFGPLGIGAVALNGKPNQVIFIDNQGRRYQARSAEMLLKQNLGLQIPVDNLVYWIRALPAPHLPLEKTDTPTHQLKSLKQQGWKIDYLDYQHQQPRLIQLTRPPITLRMVIEEWQFFN